MKKEIYVIVSIVVVSVLTMIICYLSSPQSVPMIEMNIEALAESEDPKCTGPKEYNIVGGLYFCKCENLLPCSDLVGCY